MEKLVLIDGNSLINRAFYAMPVLSTKDGTYTNAVYGFMNMFFKMLAEEKPTFVGVAFDLKAPTFRHKMYAEYKGTRKPMPEELRPQIPLLKELLATMGIKTFELEGSEADDIIGTIAKATDVKTIIITGDKDSFQLVDEQTEVHFTKRGITDVEIYTLDNFTEKTELAPSQIIDLKALMGDSSDNIPGISGIGEKTAKSLLKQYSTVDNLYEHTDELKGKLAEKIISGKDNAFLSKTLATIDCKCGIDTDLEKMRFSLPFSNAVKQRFVTLEFKSLYSKESWFDQTTIETPSSDSQTQNTPEQIINITSLGDEFYSKKTSRLALALTDQKVSLSDGKNEYTIKVRENLFDDGFNLSEILLALKDLFTSDTKLIVFDKKGLRHFIKNSVSLDLTAPCDDLAIVKYLADFSGKEESVSALLTEYNYDTTTPAFSMFKLFDELWKKLVEQELVDLYNQVELPLSDVLFNMEESGFKVDLNSLLVAGSKYKQILSELENKIRELANEPTLNVNSPKQLGDVLFEKLKIGKGKKTKSGYSTTAEILESFENSHPIVPLILEHRQVQKLCSTYVDGLKNLIDKKSGLIHTTFNQTLTSTGRLSSKEPNLQNIPVREDMGKEIRKFFVAKSEDRVLVSADYSQIELRLLACFSKCPSLIDAFNNGKDIHTATAAKVFKKDVKDVTPAIRSRAKAVNFGIIYGMSEYGLAKTLKISNGEARDFINAYFKEYPEVKTYMDNNVNFAKQTGYAKTLLNRRRYIREISASNYNLRQFGERVAMNMPLQGSSADIIKIAMINVYNRLKKENLKSELILQVHDELIIDAFLSEKQQIEKILVEEMEGAVNLAVKLTVELGCGATWFDAK